MTLGDIWKNGSHLEKWLTIGKMGHTWKNGLRLVNYVTLEKNGSQLVKCVTLG